MNNQYHENIYLHCFATIEQLGPASLLRIMKYFGNAQKAFVAPLNKFRELKFSEQNVELIRRMRESIDLRAELEKLNEAEIQLLNLNQTSYPPLLKQIATPPSLLYYRGNLSLLNDKFALAVVGTRKISAYGQLACEQLIPDLVNAGFTIVSGLAFGVDAAAHEQTLKHGGRTIAVLGSDVDQRCIYPVRNRPLAREIIERGGLIISEYAPGSEPAPYHFPVRNRIISGITLGTLVIEADQKSGSLITAQLALDENREVFAVPGPICLQTARGTNHLIQKGAKLVMVAQDIIEEFNLGSIPFYREVQKTLLHSPLEEKIIKELAVPRSIDDLVERTKLAVHEVSSTLVMLEIRGAIRNMGNQIYLKI